MLNEQPVFKDISEQLTYHMFLKFYQIYTFLSLLFNFLKKQAKLVVA